MRKTITALFLVLLSAAAFAQKNTKLIATGDSCFRIGTMSCAVENYLKYLEQDSTNATVLSSLGKALYYAREDSLAIFYLSKAIVLKPKTPENYFYRAQARTSRNDLPGAHADYSTARQLDTNYIDAYTGEAYIFLQQNQFMPAYTLFTIAINKKPNQTADVYFARGFCLQNVSAWHQAIADYQTAISLNPKMSDAYLNMANCYRVMQDYVSAEASYTEALKLNPNNSTIYYARGFLWQDKGDTAKACSDWSTAAKMGNQYAASYLKEHCPK